MLHHSVTRSGVLLDLDANGETFADDPTFFGPLSDAQPFAGGPLVTSDRCEASHGVNVNPAHAHHVVTSPEEMVHSSKVATAIATFRCDNSSEIAGIQPDDRRYRTAERRDHDIASLAVRQRSAGLDIDDLKQKKIFHDVQTALMRAFKAAERDLIDPVIVVDLCAERLLKIGTQGAVRVGPEKRRNKLAIHFREIPVQLRFANLCQLAEVFGKAHPDISAEIESHLDLAPGGSDDPAARGQRHDAQIVMAGLVDAPAEVR